MSGRGPAVICVAFILNEKITEKNTNDLLYTEPDDPSFEKKKGRKKKKKRPTSVCFSTLRKFNFNEMERFHQIPHIHLYLYICLF